MSSWLYRALKFSRKDLEYNSRGVPGEHVGPDVLPGQSSLFLPTRKRKKNVRKKNYNQRGESESRDDTEEV